jgi:hypothetical protein
MIVCFGRLKGRGNIKAPVTDGTQYFILIHFYCSLMSYSHYGFKITFKI